MRILITGITGLLGRALQNTASKKEELFGIYYPERKLLFQLRALTKAGNVADPIFMQDIFNWAKPDVVIHTAGIGSVDFAERNKEIAHIVNVSGTEIVTNLCDIFGSRLIYISSNAVFDGTKPFYNETSQLNPINYYGKLKVEAEKRVMGGGVPWAIVRPILMYGWPYPGERDNPVVWWVKSLRAGKTIKVVDNVYSKPLYWESCAQVIWAIIRQNGSGIYHVAGKDHVSLYEFALATSGEFGLDNSLIIPVNDSYFPEIAPRPRDTSFNTGKMEKELGLKPLSLREGLKLMKDTEKNYTYGD